MSFRLCNWKNREISRIPVHKQRRVMNIDLRGDRACGSPHSFIVEHCVFFHLSTSRLSALRKFVADVGPLNDQACRWAFFFPSVFWRKGCDRIRSKLGIRISENRCMVHIFVVNFQQKKRWWCHCVRVLWDLQIMSLNIFPVYFDENYRVGRWRWASFLNDEAHFSRRYAKLKMERITKELHSRTLPTRGRAALLTTHPSL